MILMLSINRNLYLALDLTDISLKFKLKTFEIIGPGILKFKGYISKPEEISTTNILQ